MSTCPLISKCSSFFTKPLEIFPCAPITIGTTVTSIFRSFSFLWQGLSTYICFCFLYFQSVVSFFFFFCWLSLGLAEIRWSVCVSFTMTSVIWKLDLTDKRKRSFFQVAAESILLYGCTTWTLTKRTEKKLDSNYTRMLRAILNKSWRQYPTKQQLYGHLPPITKTIQVRRTRHAGHCWRSKDELISDVLLLTPSHGRAKVGWPVRTNIAAQWRYGM